MRRRMRSRRRVDENERAPLIPTPQAVSTQTMTQEHSPQTAGILRMQQLQGNAFVQRFLAERSPSDAETIQRLPVGPQFENDLIESGVNEAVLDAGVNAAEGGETEDDHKLLSLGSRGPDVVRLQEQLNHYMAPTSGEPTLDTDGIFGKDTLEVVKIIQRRKGLKVDGIVGPKTRAALRAPEAFIGVHVVDFPLFPGVMIETVDAESPGFKGGLKIGDIILKIDGIQIHNEQQFGFLIRGHNPGDTIKVDINTLTETRQANTFSVTLGDRSVDK